MKALVIAISLFAATPSPSPPVVSPQFLVGEWRSENEGGTYHFRANGTYYWHAWDMGDEGRWRLRDGHTLELASPGVSGNGSRQIIVIDRVVHETIYVRTRFKKKFGSSSMGPNQSMKPTAPFRNKFTLFATTPCRGLSLSR